MKKLLSVLLAALMLCPALVSCSDTAEEGSSTPPSADGAEAAPAGEEGAPAEEAPVEEPDPFADVDYEGRDFRVSTSVNTNDATNADKFIRGTEETNGEAVNDAVYARNEFVKELLDINLVFIESDYDYSNVASSFTTLAMAGEDIFDVLANDMYQLAILANGGYLRNIYHSTILDLDSDYWYGDAMRDLQFIEGGMYMLVGDYFTDALASAHALYVNETRLNDIFGSTEYINDMVFNGSWTIDALDSIATSAAMDTNGDGQMTEGDFFGFTCLGTWGSAIPALIGADVQFIERTDNGIEYVFNNERSVKVLEKLNEMFWGPGALNAFADGTVAGLRQIFENGQTLIMGYNRLGDLELFRDVEFGVGLVPYPKLDETQENYVTSLHDTTEIGAILSTVPPTNDEFVHTCLEVLCRETGKQVIPMWYENGLKVKYADGQDDAKMIDLIHDAITSPFAVAYNTVLGEFMLRNTFLTPLTNKQTDFASNYAKMEKSGKKMLEKVFEEFLVVLANEP